MLTRIAIDDFLVSVVLRERGRSIEAELLIAKPNDSAPIGDDMVALILETEDGTLLRATGWPGPGMLGEARTIGTTASGAFSFQRIRSKPPKRAIAVIRGTFLEFECGPGTTA